MPVETSTSTSTSGGTTTVGATVRDPDAGPGGKTKYLDVTLVLDSAKFEQLSDPVGPAAAAFNVDKSRLIAQWNLVELSTDPKTDKFIDLNFKWRVQRRSGVEYEGGATGLLIVSDRTPGSIWLVERFCICEKDSPFFVLEAHHLANFSDLLAKLGIAPIRDGSGDSKAKSGKSSKKSRKKVTRKKRGG